MSEQRVEGKQITGYCVPWSLRAGESIRLHASSHTPGDATIDVVRLSCGDPTRSGPGFAESETDVVHAEVELNDQPLLPGSWGRIDLAGLVARQRLVWRLAVRATRPHEPQDIAAVGDVSIHLDEAGALVARRGDDQVTVRTQTLDPRRWYRIDVALDCVTGRTDVTVAPNASASPGRDARERSISVGRLDGASGPIDVVEMLLATASTRDTPATTQGNFDGRIGDVSLSVDDERLRWDLAQAMDSPRIVCTRGDRHGDLYQLPTRGITGPGWTGDEQRWRDAPEQYNAVHFHKDDLYDAGWDTTLDLELPADLPSGIYCFRVTQNHGDPDGDRKSTRLNSSHR